MISMLPLGGNRPHARVSLGTGSIPVTGVLPAVAPSPGRRNPQRLGPIHRRESRGSVAPLFSLFFELEGTQDFLRGDRNLIDSHSNRIKHCIGYCWWNGQQRSLAHL